MSNAELSRTGMQLAAQLQEIAVTFHVKSEEFNVLLWESDILRAKARDIEQQSGVLPNLSDSVLLQNCHNGLLSGMPEIVDQIRTFYAAYEKRKET